MRVHRACPGKGEHGAVIAMEIIQTDGAVRQKNQANSMLKEPRTTGVIRAELAM